MGNEHSGQDFLQIITLCGRNDLFRLSVDLVDVPLGELFQGILKDPQNTLRILLIDLCLGQEIQEIRFKCRNYEDT